MDKFSSHLELLTELKHASVKYPILLVIPAISLGKPGLNHQYRDYLDQSAALYHLLLKNNYQVEIFALGALHRGDGFLHQIGKDYLITNHHLPPTAFVWEDNKFKDTGLCSVEEVQLLHQYLSALPTKHFLLTCISASQQPRYRLHLLGFGITSVFYVFPDNSDYYHQVNQEQEKILLTISQTDPTWSTAAGRELRLIAHRLRDPDLPDLTRADIQKMQLKLIQLSG